MPTIDDKRETFRRLHEDGFFILPNAWDVGSAVRLGRLGFKAIASSSAGAAWAVGREDGDLTCDEVLAHLEMLVAATDLPVNADFENGFGDAPEDIVANVVRAVHTGIAGLSIEDWSGERMYDLDLATERVAAARAAIDGVDPSVMLIGRNENFRVPGMTADQSIARAVAYAAAGADCLFVPMLQDHGALKELVSAVAPKPLSMIIPHYDDPICEWAALGVRRGSTGGGLAKLSWAAFERAASSLAAFDR